jgi:hypothetical protein
MNEESRAKISHLYGGEVVVQFNPDAKRDRYKVTDRGEKVRPPSVTTITNLKDKSSPLMKWAVNCAIGICREKVLPDQIHGQQFLEDVWKEATENYSTVRKKAADVGTQVHYSLERYFKDPPDVFAPPLAGTPVRARFDEAVKWFSARPIKNICTESVVYSRKHNYIGTLDNLSEVAGVLTLVDFKAAKSVYSTYIFQASAYIMARAEETGEKAEQIYILQIGEEKTIPYRYGPAEIETAFEGFLGLLHMYDAEKKLGRIKPEESDWIDAL